jgi:hypothetical protein
MKNCYWIETVHGVVVDVVNEIRLAKNSAEHKGNHPRVGKTPCRIYTFNGKGEKVYL